MLEQYLNEKGMEVDLEYFSEKIFYYTSGYPFLVSRLCKIIDEEILTNNKLEWKELHLEEAVKSYTKALLSDIPIPE